jgi:ATP-dependent exoDNAse (exonuclease V) alpha subunit
MTKVIVWDEAPMSHRFQMEALDRTLRDVTGKDTPFGGIVTVLSGDFRQCLAVIQHANRAEIVNAALNRSPLWSSFTVMQLKENMRIILSKDPDTQGFDDFTLKLGDGSMEVMEDTDLVEIPNTVNNPQSEKSSMKRLADHVYPNLSTNFNKAGWMEGRAILAPTNKQVDNLNNSIADSFPGNPIVLTSSDELINPDDFQRYNYEYLNSLSPSGLPSHRLFIKPGMPLMLMRNLNPKMGLCNGTRLIFQRIHRNHLLECKIVGGEHRNRTVLIPRITLRPKEREFPFEWSRRQFPVRVAFAMTINKSQGQTLQKVGVWLNDTCFAHGQLYVAMSRVGSPKDIKFAIRQIDNYLGNLTSNVVYKEVLIKGRILYAFKESLILIILIAD